MLDWISYWQFKKKPFDRDIAPFLAIPGRIEVVDELLSEVVADAPMLQILGASGMGVSSVWREVSKRAKSPNRRVSAATASGDRLTLYRELARNIGVSTTRLLTEPEIWRGLQQALETARRQGFSVLVAVDDVQTLMDDPGALDRLKIFERDGVSLLVAGRCSGFEQAVQVELPALTRSQAVIFLNLKLKDAGRDGSLFRPEALARLHAEARGIPAALENLAERALRLGAAKGAEAVSLAIVEAISQDQVFPGWRTDRLVG